MAADDRRARALELHLAGATYDAIATALGYASRSGAHKAVQEALNARGRATHSEATNTQLARLDAMLTSLWPAARRGDLPAIDRVLKIEAERRALLMLGELQQEPAPRETGLSDFEKRLRERESGTKTPRRATRRP